MRKYLYVTFGIFLSLSAIWGGAYGMSTYPYGHWANFPIYLTTIMTLLGGICQVVFAVNMPEVKK